MCALIILRSQVRGFPLVVGANRDEFFDRPAIPPHMIQNESVRILAPQDQRAGGTWLGINVSGVFAAVTNRPANHLNFSLRSRGLLLQDLLSSKNVDEAKQRLERELREREYNPFNLFLGSSSEAWVGYLRDQRREPVWTSLSTGIHLLTNEHELNELVVEEVEYLVDESDDLDTVLPRLKRILSDHTDREGHVLCKHLPKRGTRSSSLLAVHEKGLKHSQFWFAEGSPCKNPFQDYSKELGKL